MQRLIAVALLIAGFWCASLQAQMRPGVAMGGVPFRPPVIGSPAQPGVSFNIGLPQKPFHNHFSPGSVFLGEPWLPYYPDVGTAQPPQIIVVQQPAAVAPEIKQEPKAAAPLMIELQGDHYVRYGGGESAGSVLSREVADLRAGGVNKGETKASAAEAPAVLVFRDGHREDVSSYSIFGGAMYVSSNYWSTGAWTKKIRLADLDLADTAKLNQERGVKFVLPSAPNEVVTRP